MRNQLLKCAFLKSPILQHETCSSNKPKVLFHNKLQLRATFPHPGLAQLGPQRVELHTFPYQWQLNPFPLASESKRVTVQSPANESSKAIQMSDVTLLALVAKLRVLISEN